MGHTSWPIGQSPAPKSAPAMGRPIFGVGPGWRPGSYGPWRGKEGHGRKAWAPTPWAMIHMTVLRCSLLRDQPQGVLTQSSSGEVPSRSLEQAADANHWTGLIGLGEWAGPVGLDT